MALPQVNGRMPLPETWCKAIQEWATRTTSVREVWLFGSHAQGTAGPDSDIDLAIVLVPPTRGHDWARGNYERFGDNWQNELKAMFGRHVSLELLPSPDQDIGSRVLLWTRHVDSPVRM